MAEETDAVPFIIDRGVIFNKRDMARLLQGLDHVEYVELVDNKPLLSREGYIVEIFEDPAEASIFFNRRIHLNVNSIEYVRVNYNFPNKTTQGADSLKARDAYVLELAIPGGRFILLRPLTDPLDNPDSLSAEVEERRRGMTAWEEVPADVEDD